MGVPFSRMRDAEDSSFPRSMSDSVHLYVGRSEEEYKEANESLRLNRVFLLLVSPLCITGLIGDQDLGSPGRVLSLFGFLSNIAYITLSLYR